MHQDPIIIVGAGLAGYTVAKELRKLAPEQPITLVTADSGDVYSKPMLSNALVQGHAPEALVQASGMAQAEKLNLNLIANCIASAIQPDEHILVTDTGRLRYSHLVLALGARPRKLDVPGAEHVLSVNNLEQYATFRNRLKPGARVCILGAGLVGCEFANDLAASGHAVSLVEIAERPLQNLAPADLSLRLQASLSALGVQWQLGSGVSRISQSGEGLEITLGNGVTLQADLVLAATGLVPETALALASGIAVGKGIQVDAMLACNLPDIHAVGDCAEVDGLWLPYVLPLMQQARALAATLAGTPTRLALPALPVAVKTPACPIVLCSPGAQSTGGWQRERDDAAGAIYQYSGPDGSTLGFALAGNACGQRRQWAARSPALLA